MPDLDAYFRRIGYFGRPEPSLATLRALHLLHPLSIPFENLDPLTDRAVRLTPDALERKLVVERRGGYCFEQNLLFSHVLRAMGFDVTALLARVLWDRDDDGTRPRSHMLLLIRLDEGLYIADVGFGGLTMTAPLALAEERLQPTPHETLRLCREQDLYRLEADIGGVSKPLYQFDLQPQREVDIEVVNHFVATHPSSPFRVALMAARALPDGRAALRDHRLTMRGVDGVRQRELGSVHELRDVLDGVFGIAVPAGDALDQVLRRLAEQGRQQRLAS